MSFEALKGLVETYDVAQIAIWHRIDSIRSLDWKLIAADHFTGDVGEYIPVGVKGLDKPDRVHYFETWQAGIVERLGVMVVVTLRV